MKQNTTIEKKVIALHKEGWHVTNIASIAKVKPDVVRNLPEQQEALHPSGHAPSQGLAAAHQAFEPACHSAMQQGARGMERRRNYGGLTMSKTKDMVIDDQNSRNDGLEEMKFSEACEAWSREMDDRDLYVTFRDWVKVRGIRLTCDSDDEMEAKEKSGLMRQVDEELVKVFVERLFGNAVVCHPSVDFYLGYLMPDSFEGSLTAELMPDNCDCRTDLDIHYDPGDTDINEILHFIVLHMDPYRLNFAYHKESRSELWVEMQVYKEDSV